MPSSKEVIPLIVDTREQLPWEFDSTRFTVSRAGLETGDVSISGLESIVAIERKTIGDAVSTVIHEWTRFRKTLYRMAGMDQAIVVIEGSVEDILAGRYESKANPASVLGKLISIQIDHGIPVVFAGNRDVAIYYASRFIEQAVKKCGGVPE